MGSESLAHHPNGLAFARDLLVTARYLALLGLLTLSPPASGAAVPEADASPPMCVRSWSEVRYGNAGYDHIVHVANDCQAPATCDVSSYVSSEPIRVIIQPGSKQEVVTMRGSPARRFTPKVECRFLT